MVTDQSIPLERPPKRQKYGEISPAHRAAIYVLAKHADWGPTAIAKLLKLPNPSTVSMTVTRIDQRLQELDIDWLDPLAFDPRLRPGRPHKLDTEQKNLVYDVIHSKRETRALNAYELSQKQDEIFAGLGLPRLSRETINRTLYEVGLSRIKPAYKPLLSANQRKKRYDFCLKHSPDPPVNFNWFVVVFLDETPGKVGVQSGQRHVWGHPSESYHPDVKQGAQKGYTSFQFWGAVTYGFKGPCHIWKKETEEEKRLALQEIEQLNGIRTALEIGKEIAPRAALGELSTNQHSQIVRQASKKAIKRGDRSRGGVDSWRYANEALRTKLKPFLDHLESTTNMKHTVYEDNAGPHRGKAAVDFRKWNDIAELGTPSNSPDLNASEFCWPWLRRHVTKQFVTANEVNEAIEQWEQAWEDMPIKMVNKWIERIPGVIREVIRQKGDNSFHG